MSRLALLVVAAGAVPPAVHAETYWVSADGSAEWTACRGDSPLSGLDACSLATANREAGAGDTVQLRGGVYRGQQLNPQHSGRAEARLVFIRYGAEIVELNGEDRGCGIYIAGQDHITVDGIFVHDWTKGLVLYDGAEHNIIQNCEFLEMDAYTGSEITHLCVNPQGGSCDENGSVTGLPCSYNKILSNNFHDAPDTDNCRTEAYCEALSQQSCENDSGCWWVQTGGARTGWVDGVDTCTRNCGSQPDDALEIASGIGNVIQGNRFGNHAHSTLVIRGIWLPQYQRPYFEPAVADLTTHHSVIRANRFENGYRRGGATTYSGAWMLWEGNTFYDTCDEQADNPRAQSRNQDIAYAASGIQLSGTGAPDQVILRRNIFDHNGNVVAGGRKHMRIYHNTSYRSYRGVMSEAGDWTDNVVKNNIFAGLGDMLHPTQLQMAHIWIYPQGVDCSEATTVDACRDSDLHYGCVWEEGVCREQRVQGNDFSHNTFHPDSEYWRYRWTRRMAYAEFETVTADFHDNQIEAPGFVNAGTRNFDLADGSLMINAGAMLTTITAIEGNVVTVEDALYFYDGWGIPGEVGDTIASNGGGIARIIHIDYDTNRIELESADGFAVGDGLSDRPYGGTLPDIGAFERLNTGPELDGGNPSDAQAADHPLPEDGATDSSSSLSDANQSGPDRSGQADADAGASDAAAGGDSSAGNDALAGGSDTDGTDDASSDGSSADTRAAEIIVAGCGCNLSADPAATFAAVALLLVVPWVRRRTRRC